MAETVQWPGQSGRQYVYHFVRELKTGTILPDAGNYLFAQQTPFGLIPIYIGIAENLSARLLDHEVWHEAKFKHDASVIMAHLNPNRAEREMEERDLIARWNPPLNTQHRTALRPLAGIGWGQ